MKSYEYKIENCPHKKIEYHDIQWDENNKPIFLYNCHNCGGTLTWKEIRKRDLEIQLDLI